MAPLNKQIPVFCLFFVLCFVLALSSVPPFVENGFFEGRSGEIIIAPKDLNSQDSFLLLTTPFEDYKSNEIADTQVAELISHLFGSSSMNSFSSRKSFPAINLFDRPRANVFIAIDGIGEDILSRHPGFSLSKSGQKISITSTSYSHESLTQLTTLLTGATPSHHGIVSEQWISDEEYKIQAFGPHGEKLVPSFPQVLSQQFGGKSLTLSFSGSYQMAEVSEVNGMSRLKSYAYSWGRKDVDEQLSEKDTDLIAQLMSSLNPTIKCTREKNIFRVEVNQKTTEYDLNQKESLEFLEELGLVETLIGKLQSSPQLRSLTLDNVPDQFSLVFSSIKNLKLKFGEDSNEFAASLDILDAVLANILSKIRTQFDGRINSEVVFLGAQQQQQATAIQALLSKTLSSDSTFSYFPMVYASSGVSENALSSALANSDFEVYSFHSHSPQLAKWRLARNYGFVYSNATYSADEVAVFQMCLWIPIILIVVIFIFACNMAYMSGGKDSLLYRASSSRHQHSN